jgi:hypothetical protein
MDLKPKLPFPAADVGAWIGFTLAVIGAMALVGFAKRIPVVGPVISKVV